MHTDSEIFEKVRTGELPALTAETLPLVAARLQEIGKRLETSMRSGFVCGNPLPAHFHTTTASVRNQVGVTKLKHKPAKLDRAQAVALLVGAAQVRRSTLRRKQL